MVEIGHRFPEPPPFLMTRSLIEVSRAATNSLLVPFDFDV